MSEDLLPMEYTGLSGPAEFGPDDAVSYQSIDNIAVITINRDRHPKFNAEIANRLHDAWIVFNASSDRVAVLLGIGMDIASGRVRPEDGDWKAALYVWWCFPGVGVEVPKPVIAAVDHDIVGTGLGLTVFSDIVVAADSAVFSYPEAKIGIAGGVGASLATRIPHKIAVEILVVGDPVTAQRAYEVGLVNQVVPSGDLVEAAMVYARKIAANSPRCVALMKKFADDTLVKSPGELSGLARRSIIDVVYSEDRKEGFKAMAEQRAAVFTGN